MTKPRAWHGALAGGLLATAFVSVSFLGWSTFGLPFLPFDLFDWTTRLLPGPVVTAGIDASVAIVRFLGAPSIGAAAKAGQQAMAVGAFVAGGVAGGGLLFALLRRSGEPTLLLGSILGAILGGVAVVIEQQLDRLATGPPLSGPWVFATLLAVGIAFGWVHDRLRGLQEKSALSGDAAVGRRRFLLQLGGSTFATTVAATCAGVLFGGRSDALAGTRWSDTHPLPNADASVTPLPGTRPEFTPLDRHYRVDTNTRVPQIDGARWRLRVGGMVQSPLTLTLDDLRQYEPLDQFVTLSCISNPPGGDLISTTRWTGVSLRRLLQEFVLSPAATHLRLTSADGFFESVAVEAIRGDGRIMLAYAWDGVPLLAEHGFPLRLYVPSVYGMKQPKWIVAIDAEDRWRPGYWVARGWDREGTVQTTSAIDAISPVRGDSAHVVELGGMACAGSRGISKVDVRVNQGDWQAAQLRDPLSETTWVLWRARVAVQSGRNTFAVRAFDGRGRPQESGFHTRDLQL